MSRREAEHMAAVNLAVFPQILPADQPVARAPRSANAVRDVQILRPAFFSMDSVLFADLPEHELVPRCCREFAGT
jgi:hypothetical protein